MYSYYCYCRPLPTPDVAIDVEFEQLCDFIDEETIVPFFCKYIITYDSTGAILSETTSHYELDKTTPYVPQGEVGKCPPELCEEPDRVGVITDWDQIDN